MSIADLNLIFENENEAFYLRQSNKNKYYYKGIKQGSKISKLKRVNSSEFWEEFNKNKAPVFQAAKIPEEKPEKPETLNFEAEAEKEEISQEVEAEEPETEENTKKSIFDRSIF